MTDDRHPSEDQLLDLALGQVDAVARDRLSEHLVVCPACRQDVDDLAVGVERALPAVPRFGPPTGFEDTVMARLRSAEGEGRSRGRSRMPRRVLLTAAATLALGAVAGGGVTLALVDQQESPVATDSTWARPLTDESGTTVGTVSPSYGEQGAVLVVDVRDDAATGSVVCRLVLADGTTREVGEWEVAAGRPNSWVVSVPATDVAAVQLVDETGRVRSSSTF